MRERIMRGPAPKGTAENEGEKPFTAHEQHYDHPHRSFGEHSDRPRRSFHDHSNEDSDRPRRSFGGPRREDGDRPRRSFDGPRREDGDRPRRSFGGPRREDGDRPRRSFDGPRREDGDRPRRSFDGPRREDGDRPHRSFGGPRREDGDRPHRSFGGPRREDGDRPRRSFDGPRREDSDRPRRSFGGPRREDGDRPRRSFGGPRREDGDRPHRSFGGPRREDGDRPRRSFGGYGHSDSDRHGRPFDHDKYEKKAPIEQPRKPKGEKPVAKQPSDPDLIRLNKYIANSGVCSRREADEYITAGLVTVNGEVITELGTKVHINDDVRFNGERLKGEKKVYIIMNKPKDFVTTTSDPNAEKNVMDLINPELCPERIFPVGRLDKSTTGVLLFTNDGALTETLTHPSYERKKIYQADLDKNLKKTDFDALLEGIELEDGPVHADAISYIGEHEDKVGVEIHSGRNRIVRRMFEHLGYDVKKLDRVYFAGLTKKNIRRGQWRFLTEQEVSMLKMNSYE